MSQRSSVAKRLKKNLTGAAFLKHVSGPIGFHILDTAHKSGENTRRSRAGGSCARRARPHSPGGRFHHQVRHPRGRRRAHQRPHVVQDEQLILADLRDKVEVLLHRGGGGGRSGSEPEPRTQFDLGGRRDVT